MSLITKNRLPAIGVVHDDWLVYGPREDQWHRLVPRRRHRAHGGWLFVSGGEVALAALEQLPGQARLTVAGAALIDAGTRVRVLGPVAHADLPYAYAAADVVIAPSVVEEPFGLVPLEAMGLGRPVVATARGGAAEYLRDGVNALVVEPDDPAAVAAAVRRLADDPALRGRLRHGGIATAREHTAERFHARVEAALADAVRGARR